MCVACSSMQPQLVCLVEYFGICMDRMFNGASIAAAVREMYNGRPDPWQGVAGPKEHNKVG